MRGLPRILLLLILLVLVSVAAWLHFGRRQQTLPLSREFLTNALARVQSYEQQQASAYWGPELVAEKYGRLVEDFWDKLNRSTNKWQIAAGFPVQRVTIPSYESAIRLPHGIELNPPHAANRVFSGAEWAVFLRESANAGWALVQCEFRQIGFTNSQPAASRYYFSAHVENASQQRRAIFEGDLMVQWEGSPEAPKIGIVDATRVELRARSGEVPFKLVFDQEVTPKEGSYFIDPIIVWDLDRDGRTEIILPAVNQVYRRNSEGKWAQSTLCTHDPRLIFTGALGDFNGDGIPDLLCAKFEGLFLYEGSASGGFPDAPRQVWSAQPHLKYAQTIAIGDIDGDGDLDVFLGQYKVPYDKGQMPRPYFDATDSNPSYLLENDGHGNFTDVTLKSRFGAKRGRRVYNANFIDLDRDGKLDLLLVSDFAGLDLFRNEGSGRFKDITADRFAERQALGMANCFADFNGDGRLDILMIGMNSPTADRLASLGLARPYDVPDQGRRDQVTFGNRLLLARDDGSFGQTQLSAQVARTGWSWGCAAEDFDNDGFADLYIANGHESRETVRDYEPEFWLHDIYVGDSIENPLAQLYFREKMLRTRARGWSYGGYEKNRFFLNQSGTNFLECAFLMGLALEQDCRNVVACDLDADGRADVIVTTFELFPKVRQTLKIFRNEIPVETNYSTLVISDLRRSGVVVSDGTRAHALPATGSYRSQLEPSIRGTRTDLTNIVSALKLRPAEYQIR